MKLVNKILKLAEKEVGYTEGEKNYNKYSEELYGSKGQEWCADFIRWLFVQCEAGDLFPESSYVPTIAEYYDKKEMYHNSERWGGSYIPKKGDLILIDNNENKTSDHIGIIKDVDTEKKIIYTIEGNYNNQVQVVQYSFDNEKIRAYVEMNYAENGTEPLKSVDEIVKEVINGEWGNGEERKKKLEEAGYNYNEIQSKVNEKLHKPLWYTIRRGDTLTKIANEWNTTVENLVKLNNIKDANKIYEGDKIKLK